MEAAMNTGMLWFDNDPKTDLDAKIIKAAKYYQTKYGQNPNLCFVHPNMLANVRTNQLAEQKQAKINVEVRPSTKILPNHLWLGVRGSPSGATR
jgi:hypothetical protein